MPNASALTTHSRGTSLAAPNPPLNSNVSHTHQEKETHMALITCKECKNTVSDTAEKCPSCGAKVPKKTSMLTWAVVILLGLMFMGAIGGKNSNGGTSSGAPTLSPKEEAMANISLDGQWRKEGFGNIMEADFVVKNKSKYDVKDIEIECTHSANSGTKIDSNKRVAYEIFKANKNKKLKDFNMGFMHSQATSTSCSITDLVVING